VHHLNKRRKTLRWRQNGRFSAATAAPQAGRQFSLQPSLLIPSDSHRKSCGKRMLESAKEMMCKSCGKSVDFLRITPAFAVQNAADFLRGNSGLAVENLPGNRRHPVDLNV
jgi:hypothetical protein